MTTATQFKKVMGEWKKQFHPPQPPPEFAEIVRNNLAEAHKGALIELGLWIEKPERLCWGCGCNRDEHTKGCHTCYLRHYQRRKSNSRTSTEYFSCTGCGIDLDELNPDCKACRWRHNRRKRRGINHVPVPKYKRPFKTFEGTDPRIAPLFNERKRQNKKCAGCDGDLDEFTPGCLNCNRRHWQRRKALEKAKKATENASKAQETACEAK